MTVASFSARSQRTGIGAAARLRDGQDTGQVAARIDPVSTADALLAVVDGLTSHVLQGIHQPDSALAVLDGLLDQIFTRPADL